MKSFRKTQAKCFLLIIIIIAETVVFVNYKVCIKPESKLWIEGTSTLHPYESKATVINLDTEAEFGQDLTKYKDNQKELFNNIILTPKIRKFLLEIPVKNMKSGIVGLDPNMHSYLKSKKFPTITFYMTDYKVEPDAKADNKFLIKAVGVLKIAGKEKQISLETIAETSEQFIKVNGMKEVYMTDFGIKPPSLLFGKIVCDNKIVVKWEVIGY